MINERTWRLLVSGLRIAMGGALTNPALLLEAGRSDRWYRVLVGLEVASTVILTVAVLVLFLA